MISRVMVLLRLLLEHLHHLLVQPQGAPMHTQIVRIWLTKVIVQMTSYAKAVKNHATTAQPDHLLQLHLFRLLHAHQLQGQPRPVSIRGKTVIIGLAMVNVRKILTSCWMNARNLAITVQKKYAASETVARIFFKMESVQDVQEIVIMILIVPVTLGV